MRPGRKENPLMSQFESPFNEVNLPGQSDVPPRTSGLAIVALISSLVFCCPVTTLLGPVLGLIALVTIKPERNERGKGLAIAAILIGVVLTILWIYSIVLVAGVFRDYLEYMQETPQHVIERGYAGDYDAFRSEFLGSGARASDAEIQQFLTELTSRYGQFVSIEMHEDALEHMDQRAGQPTLTVPFTIEFTNATREAEIEFYIADPDTGGLTKAIRSIVIFDQQLGDIEFPDN
jgi:hypothetical protein